MASAFTLELGSSSSGLGLGIEGGARMAEMAEISGTFSLARVTRTVFIFVGHGFPLSAS